MMTVYMEKMINLHKKRIGFILLLLFSLIPVSTTQAEISWAYSCSGDLQNACGIYEYRTAYDAAMGFCENEVLGRKSGPEAGDVFFRCDNAEYNWAGWRVITSYYYAGVEYNNGGISGFDVASIDCGIESYNPNTQQCEPPEYFVTVDPDADIKTEIEYGLSCPSNANPISFASGNKYKVQTDLTSEQSPLRFTRFYNAYVDNSDNLRASWRHSYMRYLQLEYPPQPVVHSPTSPDHSVLYSSKQQACESGWLSIRGQYVLPLYRNAVAVYESNGVCRLYNNGRSIGHLPIRSTIDYIDINPPPIRPIAINLYRQDGSRLRFSYNGLGPITPAPGVKGTLLKTATGFEYTDSANHKEIYDTTGRLLSLVDPNGRSQTLSYDTSSGQLQHIADNLGNSLDITYNANTRLASISYNGLRTWQYSYTANGMLATVTQPDTTQRTYHYDDSRFPTALTGLTDERGIRAETYSYDAEGHAISSTLAGNVDKVDILYNADGSRTVTNSRGFPTTYDFIDQNGEQLVSQVTGPGCASCGDGNSSYVYDPATNELLSKTINGITTDYGNYGSNGNPGYIIDAAGTTEARRTDYTYDPRFFSKIQTITEPSVFSTGSKVTTYSYDDFANPTQISIDGYQPDGTAINRTYAMQYTGPLNQLSQIDGPRPASDVNDITTLSYYPNDVLEGHNRARLKSVTSGGLLVRDNLHYTATGKLQSEQRLNGLTVSYTYYPGNDRLDTLTESDGVNSRTTRWTYLASGEVETITLGHGTLAATTLTLGYDDARRLTSITDGLGNTISYRLDTEGNRLGEDITDPSGVLNRTLNQTFDAYNRLDTVAQANESRNDDIAADGTLSQTTDGNGTVTDYQYDALKRLTQTTQDWNGLELATANLLSHYGYDLHGNLTSVLDANGGQTTYVYDDLGNLLSQTSPDTGSTTYSYDEAGNLKTRTDANGILLTYHYDALNRITTLDAPGIEDDISYSYDTCANGAGRLCTIVIGDGSGNRTTAYGYDSYGQVNLHQGIVYGYDEVGRLKTISYPSGNLLTYTYNAAGQVDSVTLDDGTATTPLASHLQYAPFGPITDLTYGNGLTLNQSHDSAYRLQSQSITGTYQQSYPLYDGNGNLNTVTDELTTQSNTFTYDALNRLDTASGSFGNRNYGYDANSNRTQLIKDSITTTSVYQANSNRLQTHNGASITLDNAGNTTNDGTNSYGTNSYNRLTSVNANIRYHYNALGQRISKTVDGTTTNYSYGLNGQLLGEYNSAGALQAEYLYLNGQPLAVYHPIDTAPPQQPVDRIIDNLDPGASYTGVWTPSTSTWGYEGSNYHHTAPGSVDTFTWQPNVSAPGDYAVYAKWTSHVNRAANASYTIEHSGGQAAVNVNQQLNGGQWQLLGTYPLDNQSSVNLHGAADGYVIADAIRIVSVAPAASATGLHYLHTDHLGTPRKASNDSGTVVWEWNSDPFGASAANDDPDGDGNRVTINLRFAGQYYDSETGLHYNYFRYYDPQTGRYITSDPIGLAGGLNTYGYVGGNPLSFVDPYGLDPSWRMYELRVGLRMSLGLMAPFVDYLAEQCGLPSVDPRLKIVGGATTFGYGTAVASAGSGVAFPLALAGSGGWQVGSGIYGSAQSFYNYHVGGTLVYLIHGAESDEIKHGCQNDNKCQ